ncbi:MAG: hypothetical protein R3F54_19565 [Alphaproteobacteria bacterium]
MVDILPLLARSSSMGQSGGWLDEAALIDHHPAKRNGTFVFMPGIGRGERISNFKRARLGILLSCFERPRLSFNNRRLQNAG